MEQPQQYGNLISSRISGTTSYHDFDALGSTRQLMSVAGSTTDVAIYDAWGNVVNRAGTTSIALLWVGELGYYFDSELGLGYVRQRVYGPTAGRWTAADPAIRSLNGNRFVYSTNRPISLSDPSGFDPAPPPYRCPGPPPGPLGQGSMELISEPPDCCCCVADDGVEGLGDQNYKGDVPFDPDNPDSPAIHVRGHRFFHTAELDYRLAKRKGDCSIQWFECSNSETESMRKEGIKPGEWHDVFKVFAGSGGSLQNWEDYLAHKPPYDKIRCPDTVQIKTRDTPVTPDGLSRILNIAIRVSSTPDCDACGHKSLTITLHQILRANEPPKAQQLTFGIYKGKDLDCGPIPWA